MKNKIMLFAALTLSLLGCEFADTRPSATPYEFKSMRQVTGPVQKVEDLGVIPGTFSANLFKLTVDSVEYILVYGGDNTCIIKHKDLNHDSK